MRKFGVCLTIALWVVVILLLLFSHSGNAAIGDVWAVSTPNSSGVNVDVVRVNGSGHLIPGSDNAHDLGITGARWRNIKSGGTANLFDVVVGDSLTLPRRIVTTFPYTTTALDEVIIGCGGSGARTVNLAAASSYGDGAVLIVKDEAGNAGTGNIAIDPNGAETVDGAATIAIATNYGVVRLFTNGANWFTF